MAIAMAMATAIGVRRGGGIGRKDAEAELNLPPGFRFHPTDDELVIHYLCCKVGKKLLPVPIIAEVDLYKYDPWDLPEKALFGQRDFDDHVQPATNIASASTMTNQPMKAIKEDNNDWFQGLNLDDLWSPSAAFLSMHGANISNQDDFFSDLGLPFPRSSQASIQPF